MGKLLEEYEAKTRRSMRNAMIALILIIGSDVVLVLLGVWKVVDLLRGL